MAFHRFPYSNFHDLNLDWIIEQMLEWSGEWEKVYQAYKEIDVDIQEIENASGELQGDVLANTRAIASLNTDMTNLQTRVNNLNARFITLSNMFDAAFTDLDNRVTALENAQAMYMFSPFTGEYVPMSTVIYELAQFHLADALTATEYDTLDLTATYYDAKDLTAIQYDGSGKILLP